MDLEVVVADEADRGKALVNLLLESGYSALWFDGNSWKSGKFWDQTPTPEVVELALVHYPNRGAFERHGVLAKCVVYYSGGAPQGAHEYWIQRSLDNPPDVTVAELDELVAWARSTRVGSLPSLLVSTDERLDWLAAAAILCQVYLAVMAANSDTVDSECAEALRQIGWDQKADSEMVLSSFDEVSSSGWWLDGLSASSHDLLYFRNSVGHGKPNHPLGALLDLVLQGKPLLPPSIVARAYMFLSGQLSGRAQPSVQSNARE